MASKVDGYRVQLTSAEQHHLYHTFNERRKGSKHIKIEADALWHLLQDHAELISLNRSSYSHMGGDEK